MHSLALSTASLKRVVETSDEEESHIKKQFKWWTSQLENELHTEV